MKYSLAQFTRIIVMLLLTFSAFSSVAGQVDSCSQRSGGVVGGPLSVYVNDPTTVWCNAAPGDVATASGLPIITCRNCLPDAFGHPPMFSKGGTAYCSTFDQQMIIDFSQPVADLDWEIEGARTVTDNRGYTVTMNPPTSNWYGSVPVMVHFPGSGITRLVITDPIVRDITNPDGTIQVPRYWEIDSSNWSATLGSNYDQCNCGRPTFPRPQAESVHSPDWNSSGSFDWTMDAEVSDNDGLVLKNIRLENRYMAEKIS